MGKSRKGTNCKHHSHKRISHFNKITKTKRKTKDLDQIHEDLKKDNLKELLTQPIDYDITGGAQTYCVHCARYFLDNHALKAHFKTKVHKRRIKQLSIEPYTQDEANRSAGMGSYVKPKPLEIKAQLVKSDILQEINMKTE